MKLCILWNEEVSAAGTYFQYIIRNEVHILVIVFVHEGLFFFKKDKRRAIPKVTTLKKGLTIQ